MPCFAPLKGWYAREKNPSGKRSIVFKYKKGYSDRQVTVPCGQCLGCRLERSKQWAIRIWHESQLNQDNCFITLTFNNKHLSPNSSLVKSDFQKFIKRLRKRFPDRKIRYFHCGEYGELCAICDKSRKKCRCKHYVKKLGRPHHHAILFNFDFKDKQVLENHGDYKTYTSQTLDELWSDPKTKESLGFSMIGNVTFQSAGYVARYVVKKVNGKQASSYYNGKVPEYITMSKGRGEEKGIGDRFYNLFGKEIYEKDQVRINGDFVSRPPKYYDKKFELTDPKRYVRLKLIRKEQAENDPDNTPSRLQQRRQVILERYKTKKGRSYET